MVTRMNDNRGKEPAMLPGKFFCVGLLIIAGICAGWTATANKKTPKRYQGCKRRSFQSPLLRCRTWLDCTASVLTTSAACG